MIFFNKKNNKNTESGFTLLEMLMVLAIFSILTAVTIFNYGKFNNNVIITNLAYEISLAIREAQVFSLGVRVADVNNDNDFDTRYGVMFDINSTTGNNMSFISFADVNKNGRCEDEIKLNYNSSEIGNCSLNNLPSDCIGECRGASNLTRGIIIKEICVSVGVSNLIDSSNGQCTDDGISKDKIFISFERPNPNSIIYDDVDNQFGNASILLEAPNGPQRVINISQSGQISVDNISTGE